MRAVAAGLAAVLALGLSAASCTHEIGCPVGKHAVPTSHGLKCRKLVG